VARARIQRPGNPCKRRRRLLLPHFHLKKAFKLDPGAVILDEEGSQYEMKVYKYMDNDKGIDDQIMQTTIYPGVEREGVIYFEPNVKTSVMEVTLFLYINGIKYEFAFSPYG
jgi:hypothetical protein